MKTINKILTLSLLLCFNLSLFAGNREVRIYITPPENDGGHPVVGYTIERLIVGQTLWVKIGATINREYVATNLTAIEYKFRVTATNNIGIKSDPSEPKDADLRTVTSKKITCICKDIPGPVRNHSEIQNSNWYNYLSPLTESEIKIPHRPM